MARVLLALVVILVIATVYAVVDASLMNRDRVRALPKIAWIAVIIIVPVIGIVLWFVVGRAPAAAQRRPVRPDDAAPSMSDAERAEQDERIRQLEADLAALDAEDEAERGRRAAADGDDGQERDATDDDDPHGRGGARGDGPAAPHA